MRASGLRRNTGSSRLIGDDGPTGCRHLRCSSRGQGGTHQSLRRISQGCDNPGHKQTAALTPNSSRFRCSEPLSPSRGIRYTLQPRIPLFATLYGARRRALTLRGCEVCLPDTGVVGSGFHA